MKGACAGHVQRTALVDGARIGAQNAILCWCNTMLGINLRVHGAHNVKYKYPSGARKSNIPYWASEEYYRHYSTEKQSYFHKTLYKHMHPSFLFHNNNQNAKRLPRK